MKSLLILTVLIVTILPIKLTIKLVIRQWPRWLNIDSAAVAYRVAKLKGAKEGSPILWIYIGVILG